MVWDSYTPTAIIATILLVTLLLLNFWACPALVMNLVIDWLQGRANYHIRQEIATGEHKY